MLNHFLKLIPQNNKNSIIGRPKINPVHVLQGIFYLLITDCQCDVLPRCFGHSSTIHEIFKQLILRRFNIEVHNLNQA